MANEEYFIFIDESGSLNNFNLGSFIVTITILNKANYSKIKNTFKREQMKLKKLIDFDIKKELKAHTIKLENQLDGLQKIITKMQILGTNFCCSYVNNEGINPKWLNNKNITYNFMVKAAIERALDINLITPNSKLNIVADMRSSKLGKFDGESIKDYLIAEFVLNKEIFQQISFDFHDSKNRWDIQLVDYFSFWIFNSVVNKKIDPQIRDRFRKIH